MEKVEKIVDAASDEVFTPLQNYQPASKRSLKALLDEGFSPPPVKKFEHDEEEAKKSKSSVDDDMDALIAQMEAKEAKAAQAAKPKAAKLDDMDALIAEMEAKEAKAKGDQPEPDAADAVPEMQAALLDDHMDIEDDLPDATPLPEPEAHPEPVVAKAKPRRKWLRLPSLRLPSLRKRKGRKAAVAAAVVADGAVARPRAARPSPKTLAIRGGAVLGVVGALGAGSYFMSETLTGFSCSAVGVMCSDLLVYKGVRTAEVSVDQVQGTMRVTVNGQVVEIADSDSRTRWVPMGSLLKQGENIILVQLDTSKGAVCRGRLTMKINGREVASQSRHWALQLRDGRPGNCLTEVYKMDLK
ncbi:hypothetical protein GCM10007301_04900 [Azorhizobium oxalatiphilum]|uniref:Uncharacterized protein n=1 Tax=Azorhizobium oxalatiphilum TaxID=980631 RepID=A0A917BLV6_9HYPH|nr:hypothetical protein GCM10007301_04900 [Azorhizobium oxalatiphilum]